MKKGIIETVIGGLILAGILYLLGRIPGFYPTLVKWGKSGWTFAVAPVSTSRWLYWLLVGICVLIVLRRLKLFVFRDRDLNFRDYTEDQILGLTWRWDHDIRGQPVNSWCYCPVCDTALVYTMERDLSEYEAGREYTELHCESCGRKITSIPGAKHDVVSRALRQVDRKLRSGDWRKVVERNILAKQAS